MGSTLMVCMIASHALFRMQMHSSKHVNTDALMPPFSARPVFVALSKVMLCGRLRWWFVLAILFILAGLFFVGSTNHLKHAIIVSCLSLPFGVAGQWCDMQACIILHSYTRWQFAFQTVGWLDE